MASSRKSFAKMRSKLYACSSSMKKTSVSKEDDNLTCLNNRNLRYVVHGNKVASFPVVDFDALQRKWYPCKKGENHPCSVDAVHLGSVGDIYAVEFKIGCVETANLIRKIHETVMGFVENLKSIASEFAGYDYYRKNLIYIVVATELEYSTAKEKTFFRAFGALRKPWESSSFPLRWHLKPLEGVLISKVYELSPSMFLRFVKEEKWIAKYGRKSSNKGFDI